MLQHREKQLNNRIKLAIVVTAIAILLYCYGIFFP